MLTSKPGAKVAVENMGLDVQLQRTRQRQCLQTLEVAEPSKWLEFFEEGMEPVPGVRITLFGSHLAQFLNGSLSGLYACRNGKHLDEESCLKVLSCLDMFVEGRFGHFWNADLGWSF